jgi:hypothetical protein
MPYLLFFFGVQMTERPSENTWVASFSIFHVSMAFALGVVFVVGFPDVGENV